MERSDKSATGNVKGRKKFFNTFGDTHPLRRWAFRIVASKYFSYLILATIFANFCALAAQNYSSDRQHNDAQRILLETTESICLTIYIVECCLKIIARGFISGRLAYGRNLYCITEFFVIIMGLLGKIMFAATGKNYFLEGFFHSIYLLRAATIFYFVPEIEMVVLALRVAIYYALPIILLWLFVWLTFAVLGLQFYAVPYGIESACYNSSVSEHVLGTIFYEGRTIYPCLSATEDCASSTSMLCVQNQTDRFDVLNFENIYLALLTTFVSMTTAGWTNVLYYTDDLMGSGSVNWLYFVTITLLGSCFVVSLVLAVLAGNFSKERERVLSRILFLKFKRLMLLEHQLAASLRWIDESSVADPENAKPLDEVPLEATEGDKDNKHDELPDESPPAELPSTLQRLRRQLRRLFVSRIYHWCSLAFVFVHAVILALDHKDQSTSMQHGLRGMEYAFWIIYIAEMSLKMLAFGLKIYFNLWWNTFDFIVNLATLFEFTWDAGRQNGTFGLQCLRVLRLIRIFRFTRYSNDVRNVILSFLSSTRTLLGLFFLFWLVWIVATLLGMQAFGGQFMNFQDSDSRKLNIVSFTFDTFPAALVTVFQAFVTKFMVLAGEGWTVALVTTVAAHGGPYSAGIFSGIYFIVVSLIGTYLLLYCFIIILGENLANAQSLSAAETAELGEEKEELKEKETREAVETPRIVKSCNQPISNLWLFAPSNRVRIFFTELATTRRFQKFFTRLVLLNCIVVVVEDPVDFNSTRNIVLHSIEAVFTLLFAAEFLINIIVMGFVMHRGSYARSVWNLVDLAVIVCVIIGLSLRADADAIPNVYKVKYLLMLRAFRLLRFIRKIRKLNETFFCVINIVRNALHALVIAALVHITFALIAVRLFKGTLSRCSDPSKTTEESCLFFNETTNASMWTSYETFNYDNFGISMLSLLVALTAEGWHAECIFLSLFKILYIIVFLFCVLSVVVMIVMVCYNEAASTADADLALDLNQKRCLEFIYFAKPVSSWMPNETDAPLRFRVWKIVRSRYFDNVMIAVLCTNVFVLMILFCNAPYEYFVFLNALNAVFLLVFCVEITLKMIAYGFKGYFSNPWNLFDIVIVVGGVADIIAGGFEPAGVQSNYLRVFRVLRMIKLLHLILLRMTFMISTILWFMLKSFKASASIAGLAGILFYIFAIVGMQVFGDIALNENTELNRHNNFRNIFNSLMLLFRSIFGARWQNIMADSRAGRLCDFDATADDNTCGSDFAFVYFVTFVIICLFLLLRLFIASLLDTFDYLMRDNSILGPHHLHQFVELWTQHDPHATGRMHFTTLQTMLRSMPPPLGLGQKCPRARLKQAFIRMNIPLDDEGYVTFHAAMFGIVRNALSIYQTEAQEMDQADNELRKTLMQIWPKDIHQKFTNMCVVPPYNDSRRLTLGKVAAGQVFLAKYMTKHSKKYGTNRSSKSTTITIQKA